MSPIGALISRVAIITSICCLITFLLGKDCNWDIFNYHLYVAHAFWTNQDLQSDFMGASLQRYLNPIGYLPFYWMIQAGWHSLTISLTLAVFHSLSLTLLWEICARHLFRDDSQPEVLATASVALAAMSPVFLGTIGATFLDPITSVFVFAGLLTLCKALDNAPSSTTIGMVAGCFFGIAAGLKLTNLIFVASACVAILIATRFFSSGRRLCGSFGIGAAGGALLSGGWWSLKLYREFANPFFPLFNDIFRSPDFPAVKLQLIRFKPDSFWDTLRFPFDMASSRMWVYTENAAADFRFALLFAFALAVVLHRLANFRHTKLGEVRLSNASISLVASFFLISFLLWVWTSGNGRYGLPLLLLVAPILILVLRTAISRNGWFAGIVLAIVSAQGTAILLSQNPRWDSDLWKPAWSPNWIDVEVPTSLKNESHGYLSAGVNSYSFVALHVHPKSKFVNLIGAFPLSIDGPGGHRVARFISDHAGKLRMLAKLDLSPSQASAENIDFKESLNELDSRYALWDLRINAAECTHLTYSVGPRVPPALLISCALVQGNPKRRSMLPEWARASYVFDRIEIACPGLFSPSHGYSTFRGSSWYRFYLNTEVRLRAVNGQVLYSRDPFGPFSVNLGTLDDWELGKSKWICHNPQPHWKLPDVDLLAPTPNYHLQQ